MKVLELFAGTRSIGRAFEARGHEVISVEWDTSFEDIDWYGDVGSLTAEDAIRLCGGVPDVIWASPDCTTFSVAAISHHRMQEADGNLAPVSDYARQCDVIDTHMLGMIDELVARGREEGKQVYYFIENPRGGMRKMRWMKGRPRYTVTYCRYGDERMKPTDIWTNHPNPRFLPPCKNGDNCHVRAPRGARTGTQGIKGHVDRSRIPQALCEHIVAVCEEPVGLTFKQARLI